MTTLLPKPEKRGPKPRKSIPKVGAEGKRDTVSSRRKEQKRLFKRCNDLWSFLVKARADFFCQSGRAHNCTKIRQAAHGFPKKVYPATRFDPWNGLCLCSAEHSYFTWREPEWQALLRQKWGSETYDARLSQAMRTAKLDLGAVESYLLSQIALFGLDAQARDRGLL